MYVLVCPVVCCSVEAAMVAKCLCVKWRWPGQWTVLLHKLGRCCSSCFPVEDVLNRQFFLYSVVVSGRFMSNISS